jgi:hypothetical protein
LIVSDRIPVSATLQICNCCALAFAAPAGLGFDFAETERLVSGVGQPQQ